jgi:hypothetical protein
MGITEENSSHSEMCIGFNYNLPPNSCWYYPNFTRESEKEINELRDLYPNSEFLLLGDMTSCIGVLQLNLPHSWDTFENEDKEFNNPYGSRLSKYIVQNTEVKKLTGFCERKVSEILNRKYEVYTKAEVTKNGT